MEHRGRGSISADTAAFGVMGTGRQAGGRHLWMASWLAAFAFSTRFQLITTAKAYTQFKGLRFLSSMAKSPETVIGVCST
jgi:hypothetical protein